MSNLIDKDALVAEINKRIMDAPIDCYGHQRVWAYNDVKDIINSLEVKKVDLEEKLSLIDDSFFELGDGVAVKGATHYLTIEDIKEIAKLYYEYGLNAQKGESV